MPEDELEAKSNGNASDSEEDDPPPGEGLSEEIFEVENILEHIKDADNVMFYKVRWKNYGPPDDSWEPADNLTQSAGKAIDVYWEEYNKKKTKSREKKAMTKKPESSKSGSRSRGRPAKEARPPRKARSAKEEEPKQESEPEKSNSDEDDDYETDNKSRRGRPVSKGALKSYDTSKKSTRKGEEAPMNSARRTAMENRKSWLYDGSDDSDDEEPKKEKEASEEASSHKAEEKQSESAEKPRNDKKEEKKRRRDDSDEEPESTPKERRSKESGRQEVERNEENDYEEPRTKRGKKEAIRPPTPPKASTSSACSSTTVEYTNNDSECPRKISLKIKLPPHPGTAAGKSNMKQKEKATSDILYYNAFPKHRPLSEIVELKEIDLVEGVMINTKGGWNVFVRDVAGTCCILSAEEAYERCGWTLVQYLLARAKFT